jgi:hypothetical protein
MQLDRIDGGLEFDWGKTSRDYAAFRHGYPESFYELLSALGVGRPGQRILDLEQARACWPARLPGAGPW